MNETCVNEAPPAIDQSQYITIIYEVRSKGSKSAGRDSSVVIFIRCSIGITLVEPIIASRTHAQSAGMRHNNYKSIDQWLKR